MRSALAFKHQEPESTVIDFGEFACSPAEHERQHEMHWLAFVNPPRNAAYPFRTQCELWRWVHNAWRSVAIPGFSFSPGEMYDQGWRYCTPCVPLMALIRS